ncbi:hypothetical protein HYFRA_00008713 [Hymenoscyphus fraxineus]|uniref:beta-glucosidase n=1 Tax=Hymenoscyphus fraxineus TaxID=746836 RepID=A0A9N9L028_9HELO|nr:hypothetical protein HYFRA_00008713 [Hymenoscyphus fraxineus]
MIQRIMTPYYLLNQDHSDYPSLDPSAICNLGASLTGEISCSIAAHGTVLLKNVNNALPLKSPKSIAVFGNGAGDLMSGLTYPLITPGEGFDMGTLAVGTMFICLVPYFYHWRWFRFASIVDPLSAIKAKARSIGATVQYILNNTILTYTSEGYDRVSWVADYNPTAVVTNVAKRCNSTIVITHSGGINTMSWSDHPNITGILAAHYPGEESGNSLVDILWGDVNPSAKLPYTIPAKESDYDIPITYVPASNRDPNAWQADFTEGLMIDYRHFGKYNISLKLHHLRHNPTQNILSLISSPISPTPEPSAKIAPGGNPDLYTTILTATTTLSNTGSVTGAQVVQLYLSFQDTSPPNTPKRVLRGPEKVELGSGEERDVTFELTRRDLSYWEVEKSQWKIPAGEFEIQIGFDINDTRALGRVTIPSRLESAGCGRAFQPTIFCFQAFEPQIDPYIVSTIKHGRTRHSRVWKGYSEGMTATASQ